MGGCMDMDTETMGGKMGWTGEDPLRPISLRHCRIHASNVGMFAPIAATSVQEFGWVS